MKQPGPATPGGRRALLAGAAGLAGWLCGPALATLPSALPSSPPAALPPVLRRPAQPTPLARKAALLAAARAGRRLVVAGERGIVLTSDDQGASWQQARVPVQVSLTALAFAEGADAGEGWAAGHFGVLLHTRDGGSTWQRRMDGVQAAQLLLQQAADEGQRAAAQRRLEEGADKPFFDIARVGERWLAVGAYGLALATGGPREGAAFEGLTPRLPNPRQLHLYGVRAAGERVFIVGEQGLVLRSGDGGARFEALPAPYKGSLFGLHLTPAGTLLVFGLRGNVWRSTDQGESWARVPVAAPVGLSAATALPGGGFALLAQNGDLLVSRDDGASLRLVPAAPPLPAAALAATDSGELVVAGLRGLHQRPRV